MTHLAQTTHPRAAKGWNRPERGAPHFIPTVYRAEIVRSASDIDVDAWDALREPDDLFMDRRFLEVVERSLAPGAGFWHILFRDADFAPAASACLATFTLDALMLAQPGASRRIASAVARVCPALTRHKVLFCGLPFSAGQSHLRFAPGADRAAILTALDRILTGIADRERAGCIVLKEFREDELAAIAGLETLGYRRADSLPMNELTLSAASFDEFLGALNHKKRCDIRRSLKKLKNGGLRVLVTSEAAEVERYFTDDVHRLYRAVFDRATTRLELLPRQFFLEVIRQLPEHFEMFFVLEGDRVLGCGLCAFAGRWFHPLYMGLDHARNHDYDLYFNIVYQAIANAHAHSARDLALGQDADELKRSKLGAFQTPRYVYVKGHGAVMDAMIRLLFNQLFPPRPLLAPPARSA